MTSTYTQTLEEQALGAMCSGRLVRLLATDTVGRIIEIYPSTVKPNLRRIGVVDSAGRVHHIDLTYGAVRYQ